MCGICATLWYKGSSKHAIDTTVEKLFTIQHRGEEAAGMALMDCSGHVTVHVTTRGLVTDLAKKLDLYRDNFTFEPSAVLTHTRYATSSKKSTIQHRGNGWNHPIVVHCQYRNKSLALVHNGHITNAKQVSQGISPEIRVRLEEDWDIPFSDWSDSQITAALITDILGEGSTAFSSTPRAEIFRLPPARLELRPDHTPPSGFKPRGLTDIPPPLFIGPLLHMLKGFVGSYSIVCSVGAYLIVIRDPWGFRPLWYSKNEERVLVASETPAFGPEDRPEIVPPGSIMVFDRRVPNLFWTKRFQPLGLAVKNSQLDNVYPKKRTDQDGTQCATKAACSFEWIYFANERSKIYDPDVHVYDVRHSFGKELARLWLEKHQKTVNEMDVVVVGIPSTGLVCAQGFFDLMKEKLPNHPHLQLRNGFVLNKYSASGRTFLAPTPGDRAARVRKKFYIVKHLFAGKDVVLVDDSVVRGTTMTEIVKWSFEAGARSIHVCSASPPVRTPCHFGMDFPSQQELLFSSSEVTIEKANQVLGSTSLTYLGVEDVRRCLPSKQRYCTGCFSGENPLLTW